MKKTAFLILGFFLSFSLFAQSLTEDQQKSIDNVFSQWNNVNSPGCALALVQDGKITYSKGYGMADLEHGLSIQPNTVFYIGSVSKQFVTAAILLLEEQGKIDLDDDIRKYFPELPDYGYPINIRNLIHHTSGIRDYLQLWQMSGLNYLDEIEPEEALEIICRQKELNFEPGTRYLYSNSCYFMMALIVKRVTGKTIREYAQEHIFGPLEMNSTQFYDDNRRLIKNRAFGYGGTFEGEFSNMMMRFDLVGSGGIYSTVEDLYKWDQNFYHNILGSRGDKFIDHMLTNGKFKDGSDIGYAYALNKEIYRGLNTFGHGGALGGYRSHFVQFPDQKTSVIILCNFASMNPGGLAFQVADIVLADQFVEEEVVVEEEIEPIKLSPKKLKAFEGHYWNAWGNYSRRIYVKESILMYDRGNGNETELIPVGKQKFKMNLDLPISMFVSFEENKMMVGEEGDKPELFEEYTPIEPSVSELEALAGTYQADDVDAPFELVLEDGKLFMASPDGKAQIRPVSKDVFTQTYIGQVTFKRDDSGNVEGLVLDAGRVRKMWYKRVK